MSDGMVATERIGQIRLDVSDLASAVGFYRDTLGMRFLFDVPEQGMAFLQCGDVRLYLNATGAPQPTTTIYYVVESVDVAYETLRALGVAFEHEPRTVYRLDDVEGRMAFLRDPDGNSVALMAEVPVDG